jgi:hypothetical protein
VYWFIPVDGPQGYSKNPMSLRHQIFHKFAHSIAMSGGLQVLAVHQTDSGPQKKIRGLKDIGFLTKAIANK